MNKWTDENIPMKPQNQGKREKSQMWPERIKKQHTSKNKHLIVSKCLFPVGSDGKDLPAVQETWVHSLGQENPLEKGMTTHFSIPAWRILWAEDPGELQSSESQRVGHN